MKKQWEGCSDFILHRRKSITSEESFTAWVGLPAAARALVSGLIPSHRVGRKDKKDPFGTGGVGKLTTQGY